MYFLGIFVIALYSTLVLGQPDCEELMINTTLTNPIPGTDLPYCKTNALQCCVAEFLQEERRDLRNNRLLDDLHNQIDRNGNRLNYIDNGFRDYVYNTFIPRFVRSFRPPLNITVNNSVYEENLRSNFYFRKRHPNEANFTVDGFTQGLIRGQVNLIIHGIVEPQVVNFTGTQRDCVRNELLKQVNQTAKNIIDESLKELRRAATTLNRTKFWFTNQFLPNLTSYFVGRNRCADTFLNLTICPACHADIPPLCKPVCSAVIYGCYAVVQNGLRSQFNVLWNITNQLINISRNATRNITISSSNILCIDPSQYLSLGIRTCNLTPAPPSGLQPPPTRRRRESNDDDMNDELEIPDRILRNATLLEQAGIFNYDNEGPIYCRNNVLELCWNGTYNETMYTGPIFTNTSIEGQINNPYYNVTLTDIRNEVNQSGNPVTDFINSEQFQEYAPMGLVLTEDTPTPRPTPTPVFPQDTPTPTPAGASLTSASILIMILATLMAFLF